MLKRTAQKREAVGLTAASGRTPRAFEVSHVTTFQRPDLLILLGLAVVTFGIYAQVIGYRFITIDDFRISTSCYGFHPATTATGRFSYGLTQFVEGGITTARARWQ